MNWYTFRGSNSFSFLPALSFGVGSQFFPLREDPILKGIHVQENKQEVTKVVSPFSSMVGSMACEVTSDFNSIAVISERLEAVKPQCI